MPKIMNYRGRRYGRVRKSYVIDAMSSIDGKYRTIDTQRIIVLEKTNKKDLESRAKNSND